MNKRNRPQKIMGYVLMDLGGAILLAVDAPEFLRIIGWALIAVGLIVWSVRLTSLRP